MKLKEIMFVGEEDPEKGYTAQALGYSIFTEGDTLEELKENIKDALKCHFDKKEMIVSANQFPITTRETKERKGDFLVYTMIVYYEK